jgi:methionyl-tRNA formyltransferase
MRLFLIIDETHFYQPQFVADLIKKTHHEVVGAALVTKVSPKSNIESYMVRHFFYLRISELFKLGTKKILLQLKNAFYKSDLNREFYSVRKVYEYFGIDYFEVEYDINKEEYLNKISAKKPDIIVSSNSMIFGKEILTLPNYCINRHSGLLPASGGLWPVFQAVRNGDNEVGVSVHTMERKIDKGILLSQSVIPIEDEDTIDSLYQKCFNCSADTVLNAIKKIEDGDITAVQNNYIESYYSFPKKEHWQQFRKRKRKFI